jgi:RHS repeat-associated protein
VILTANSFTGKGSTMNLIANRKDNKPGHARSFHVGIASSESSCCSVSPTTWPAAKCRNPLAMLFGLALFLGYFFLAPQQVLAQCTDHSSSIGITGLGVPFEVLDGNDTVQLSLCSGVSLDVYCHADGCTPNAFSFVASSSPGAGNLPPPWVIETNEYTNYSSAGMAKGGYAHYHLYVDQSAGVPTTPITIQFSTSSSGVCQTSASAILQIGGDSCGTCNNNSSQNQGPSVSSTSANNNCLDFKINLGPTSWLGDGGYLWIYANTPSASLATPAALQLPLLMTNVQVITNTSGNIAQVLTPLALFDVVVMNPYQYQIEVFSTNVVTSPGTNGLYGTNGPAFDNWVVQNPDTNAAFTRLWVTEERSGMSNRQFQYAYTNNSTNLLHWDLLEPDGQTTVSKWYTTNSTNASLTTVYWQTASGLNILQATTRVYQTVPPVDGVPYSGSNVLSLVHGAGSVTQTTTFTYYPSNAVTGSANRLQRIDYPTGNWVYYVYDDVGRITSQFSAYNNNAPPALGVQPNPLVDLCKETDFSYDDSSVNTNTPIRTVISYPVFTGGSYALKEVSRSYAKVLIEGASSWMETFACPQPGAAQTDPANLDTLTFYYGNGDPASENRVQYVSRPDGTTTYYTYTLTGSDFTTVESTGVPDDWLEPTTILNGTTTTTIRDMLGRIQSRQVTDILTGDTLSQVSYAYSAVDPLGQDYTKTDNLSGLSTTYEFDCCGLSSVTDPDGVITSYSYDLMKRPVSMTTLRGTNAITITKTYDGLGQVLQTQRTGTDNSTITQSQSAYDVLGRVIAATNALGGVTTISNVVVGNQQSITNIFPDGGTSIALSYRDGNLESTTGTAVAPVSYQYGIEQDDGIWRQYTLQTMLTATGGTNQWVMTLADGANETYKTVYAGATSNAAAVSYFNNGGQVTNTIDPDGVSTLYVYNPKGEQALAVLDVNQNGNIDWTGPDRINFTTNYVTTADYSTTNVRIDTYVWDGSSASSNLLSTAEDSVDGLRQWKKTWINGAAVTNSRQTIYSGGTNRSVTDTAPDGSFSVSAYSYGQLISTTRYDSSSAQIAKITYGYDTQGRQNTATDARNGTTTNYFNNADEVTATATPASGTGQNSEVTTNYYDTSERLVGTRLPDGTYTTNLLNPTGLASLAYGSREYPVGNGYDGQERMTTMTNWTSFQTTTGARVTTWNYDQYRGWLSSKVYADGHGTTYGDTSAGRLASRLWARGTNASYGYGGGGDLASVSYNDGLTPSIGNGYDRLGHKALVTNGATVCTLTYNDPGVLLSESHSGGPLNGWSVTNGYDAFMRRTNMVVLSNTTPLWTNVFSYDTASRLASVSDSANSASYSYLANSSLVGQITFKQSGTTRMTTTKGYDNLNRLTGITNANASSVVLDSHGYGLNSANQRTSMTNADGSYWVFDYDAFGQATSTAKHWADGTSVAGEQFGNNFDNIGNRINSQMGGNENGVGLRNANYTVNNLNQYTSRTVPGAADILGSATNTSTVTVNGILAYRHGSYYRAELPINNIGGPVWQSVTNIGVLGGTTNTNATVTGNIFLPQNLENYVYDLDGNLTCDGRFTNLWDGENRLTNLTSLGGAPTGSKYKLDLTYDYLGRRIQKIVSTNSGSGYVASYTNKFVYDGWNVVAIMDGGNNLLYSFVWGNDLSGSLQGADLPGQSGTTAGGVGGLISMTVYNGANAGTYFYCYDGNGNVMALVNAANGNIAAQYEYGPFGELLRATGPIAPVNPFQFSTKCDDNETGLAYYGYRYYNPSTARWLSRDPLAEESFFADSSHNQKEEAVTAHALQSLNPVYCFLQNDATSRIDAYGLACADLDISGGELENAGTIAEMGHILSHLGHKNPYGAILVFAHPCAKCQSIKSAKMGEWVYQHELPWDTDKHPYSAAVTIHGDDVWVTIPSWTWFRTSSAQWILEDIDVVVTCCDYTLLAGR